MKTMNPHTDKTSIRPSYPVILLPELSRCPSFPASDVDEPPSTRRGLHQHTPIPGLEGKAAGRLAGVVLDGYVGLGQEARLEGFGGTMGGRGDAGCGRAAFGPWRLIRVHNHFLVQFLSSHLSGGFGLLGEDGRSGAVNVIVAVGLRGAVCPRCLLG